MNSSGIKRGIAVSAVTALAFTGLGLAAGPASAAVGDTDLLTLQSGTASVVNDGVNTTVHLMASAPDGGVDTVQFGWSNDGGATWNAIGSPTVEANGVFSAEWAPPSAIYNTTVRVRAQGLSSVNTPVGTPAVKTGVLVSSSAASVNIATPAGTAAAPSVGVYKLPSSGNYHGIISGTSGGMGTISLRNGANPAANADHVSAPNGNGVRTFTGVVDFGGTPAFAGGTNAHHTTVTATDVSDDAARVSLYEQQIADMTADQASITVPDDGSTGTTTFTVTDQKGRPIAGARVFSSDNSDGAGTPFGGFYYKTTDSLGQVTYADLAPSTNAYDYWANVGGGAGYDPGTDYRRTVMVNAYTQTQTTLESASADGDAFDRNEFASGDLTVTLKDQNGTPVQGQVVNYKWTGTDFNTPAGALPSNAGTATTNLQGRINVPLPANPTSGAWTLNAWVEKDGNPGEGAGDLKAPAKTLKIGQGNVVWNDGTRISVAEGTTHAFTGSIQLEDGTKLPGRSATLSFLQHTGGDAVFAAQAEQPTGTTRVSDFTATAVADANGDFTVKVSDPHGTIATKPDFGDALRGSGSNIGSNAPVDLATDFMDTVVATITAAGTSSHNFGGHASANPGVPQRIEAIHVQNAQAQPLVGVDVTISVDHGYLTPDNGNGLGVGSLTPVGQTEGARVGDWEDLGTSITIKTDENGNVEDQVAAAMGHDDGFADGNVKTTIAVSGGGKSVSSAPTVVWNANDPLNLDALSITFDVDQDSSVLPLSRADDQSVYFDQTLTDQFGNELTNPNAQLDAPVDDDIHAVAHQLGDRLIEAWSTDAVDSDQTVSVSTDVETLTWHESTPGTGVFSVVNTPDANTISATAPTINWYALSLDPTQSSFEVTHSPAGEVKPGTTVFVTYTAIDQHGQAIDGWDVDFVRTGPDTLQDGNIRYQGSTNAAGQVTYAFQGAKAGAAIVSAMLESGSGPIESTVAYDLVNFAAPSVTLKPIKVKLTAKNAGNGDDRLKVSTNKAAKGAKVTIYKVVKGKLKKIATAKIGAKGKASKKIADHRPGQKKAKTTYVVKVAKTKATKAAKSNKRAIR